MLVLSRKVHEKILIGEDVVILIVRLEGNQVRLGISAPKEVRVIRSEIASRTHRDRPRSWADATTQLVG
jgi:carbon storage regulator